MLNHGLNTAFQGSGLKMLFWQESDFAVLLLSAKLLLQIPLSFHNLFALLEMPCLVLLQESQGRRKEKQLQKDDEYLRSVFLVALMR